MERKNVDIPGGSDTNAPDSSGQPETASANREAQQPQSTVSANRAPNANQRLEINREKRKDSSLTEATVTANSGGSRVRDGIDDQLDDGAHTLDGARQTRDAGDYDRINSANSHKRSGGPPETVPRAPSLTLTYDDITQSEREALGQGGNADVYRITVSSLEGDLAIAVKEPRLSGTVSIETVERMMEEAETW